MSKSSFKSRRNDVRLTNGAVEKRYRAGACAHIEAAKLRALRQAGVRVPIVLGDEADVLRLSYIEGETLPDLLEAFEQDGRPPEPAARALADWLIRFYRAAAPGEIRGDVNGRNFIYEDGAWWGVDFEETLTGRAEQDVGRLIAFILTYDPPDTAVKRRFSSAFKFAMMAAMPLDAAEIDRQYAREIEAMRDRREGRH